MGVVHGLSGHALDEVEEINVVVARPDQGGFPVRQQLHASQWHTRNRETAERGRGGREARGERSGDGLERERVKREGGTAKWFNYIYMYKYGEKERVPVAKQHHEVSGSLALLL